jgi:hypothetical protein
MKILKTGVGSDTGTIYKCDTIEHEGKLWLVPQWLDVPAKGVRKPRRLIRMDSLPHQPMTNPAYGLDYILNDGIPKAVLEGTAPSEQADEFEIVDLPEIEFPIPPRTN